MKKKIRIIKAKDENKISPVKIYLRKLKTCFHKDSSQKVDEEKNLINTYL